MTPRLRRRHGRRRQSAMPACSGSVTVSRAMRSAFGNCPSRPPNRRPSVHRCSASYETPVPMPRASSASRNCVARRSTGDRAAAARRTCSSDARRRPASAGARREHARRIGRKPREVAVGERAPRGAQELRQAPELRQADARVDVGQVELAARKARRRACGRRRRSMPWKRSDLDPRAPPASSLTTSAPPSIEVMFLFGWKLKRDEVAERAHVACRATASRSPAPRLRSRAGRAAREVEQRVQVDQRAGIVRRHDRPRCAA